MSQQNSEHINDLCVDKLAQNESQKDSQNPVFMQKRIRNILFVFSKYDGITITEELYRIYDDSTDYYQYIHPIHIEQVHTGKEALAILNKQNFDLVILNYELTDMTGFELGEQIKRKSDIPVAMLTSQTRCKGTLTFLYEHKKVDRIFIWYGNPHIIFAIIKLFEDQLNAPTDVGINKGRAILVVEDEPFFYSSFLPMFYRELLAKQKSLLGTYLPAEVVNVQKRKRPKILLAVNYEEAVILFHRYRHNIIGCICDCQFPIGSEINKDAGLLFSKFVHENDWRIPILIQSQDPDMRIKAAEQEVYFLYKNSDFYLAYLRKFLEDYFGFGEFIFRNPDGKVIDKADNVSEFIKKIKTVDSTSLLYHGSRNHFSTWFYVHGQYELASQILPISSEEDEQIVRERLVAHVTKYCSIKETPDCQA